jgi:GTP cyclohydrolase IA
VGTDDHFSVASSMSAILTLYGADLTSESMKDTPFRWAEMMDELTAGYHDQAIWWKDFDGEGADQMVVQHNIQFHSLCEHHLLPIVGNVHVGYLPRERICGLSKLPRTVKMFSRRFQIQERMTRQIAEFLEEKLQPRGVAVLVEAEHFCMSMRGIQALGTLTSTSAVTGDFLDPSQGSREEFMSLVQRSRR